MNTPLLSCLLPVFTSAALLPAWASAAQEYGTVISKAALYEPVSIPERQCVNQAQAYQPAPSGVGSVLGAVAGGVMGNTMGRGAGQAAATGLGAIAGAVIGNQVEASATPPAVTTVQNCQTVMRNERRLTGYEVTYEYQGQRHIARVPHDPGNRIALNVSVAPAEAQQMPPATSPENFAPAPTTVYNQPAVVYTAPQVIYVPHSVAPYPPVYWGPSIGINAGWGWGHGYRHWR